MFGQRKKCFPQRVVQIIDEEAVIFHVGSRTFAKYHHFLLKAIKSYGLGLIGDTLVVGGGLVAKSEHADNLDILESESIFNTYTLQIPDAKSKLFEQSELVFAQGPKMPSGHVGSSSCSDGKQFVYFVGSSRPDYKKCVTRYDVHNNLIETLPQLTSETFEVGSTCFIIYRQFQRSTLWVF